MNKARQTGMKRQSAIDEVKWYVECSKCTGSSTASSVFPVRKTERLVGRRESTYA